ncbi:HD domain-containing protein [Cetobacterium sp. 8H]|uniref:HD domain-containing protein n=1 Tax=Cetobacterium sp. 8H TaxID=2759681 RepID=UPI00163B6A97|nr:HD domain-containing protein [Cetobacterium sp. 8H]
MISRLKQGLSCIFLNFDIKNEKEIKNVLSSEEFNIFLQMSEYDKFHSFKVYSEVLKDKVLKHDINYLKLALLHDCGKGDVTLFRRVKKVLVGDKKLEQHPNIGFEKLKEINLEVATLCKQHHNKDVDFKMSIFQEIDDK